MPTATQQFLAPRDCQTEGDVLALTSSMTSIGNHWLLVQHDGAVVLCEQRKGERATATITIPRRTFQRMLAWYETEQRR